MELRGVNSPGNALEERARKVLGPFLWKQEKVMWDLKRRFPNGQVSACIRGAVLQNSSSDC